MRVIYRRRSFKLKWGCPRARSLSNWCNALCPARDGLGDCGRPAPHALLGRTQLAILAHRRRTGALAPEGADGPTGVEPSEGVR